MCSVTVTVCDMWLHLQANAQLQGALKGRGGIIWFASDKPTTSVFLPLLVAPLPTAFSIGQPGAQRGLGFGV
jgi:hypothetical protein